MVIIVAEINMYLSAKKVFYKMKVRMYALQERMHWTTWSMFNYIGNLYPTNLFFITKCVKKYEYVPFLGRYHQPSLIPFIYKVSVSWIELIKTEIKNKWVKKLKEESLPF